MNMIYPEPAQVNIFEEREIILHMRALLDFHDLLRKGFEEEMSVFRKKLLCVGWGKNKINEMFQKAAEWTRYEFLIDSPDFGKKIN